MYFTEYKPANLLINHAFESNPFYGSNWVHIHIPPWVHAEMGRATQNRLSCLSVREPNYKLQDKNDDWSLNFR